MSSTIQQSEKTLMNMYSVHKFYLQVLQEIEQTLLTDKKERYMLNWDKDKSELFIQAVKYYLNHQPTFFNQALQKYSNNQMQSIIPKKKRRRNSTITGVQTKSMVSHKSKNTKKQSSVMTNDLAKKQTASKTKQSLSSKKQLSVISKASVQNSSKVELKNEQTSEPNQLTKQMTQPKKQEDDMSDDLMNFPQQIEIRSKYQAEDVKEDDFKSIQPHKQNEDAIFYEDEESQSDQESLSKFVQRACKKSNALVYGNFATRQLRRKAKDDKIELQLTNCFVKMFKNGRDAFFQRMTINLFKQQKNGVNV